MTYLRALPFVFALITLLTSSISFASDSLHVFASMTGGKAGDNSRAYSQTIKLSLIK